MKMQKVLFIADKKDYILQKTFWQQLRLSLYEIRSFGFNNKVDVSVAFAIPSEADKDKESVSVYNLDDFSFSKEKEKGLFETISPEKLKYWVFLQSNSDCKVTVFYLRDVNMSVMSQDTFVNIKDNIKQVDITEKFFSVMDQKVQYGLRDKKMHGTKIHKSFQFNRKTIPVISAVFAGILFISFLPMLISKIKNDEWNAVLPPVITETYQKVYTGDGDRLILRSAADINSEEIVRLNEGEVVKLLDEGLEWNHVEYHDFVGYVNNSYLVESKMGDYIIMNPDSMYNYAKCCLKFMDDPMLGTLWLEKSAENGLLQGKWELYKTYTIGNSYLEKNTEKAQAILDGIAETYASGFYEDTIIAECRQAAEVAKAQGNTDIASKLETKASDRERTEKDIYKAVYSNLINHYLEHSDAQKAADLYLVSREQIGVSESTDIMEEIADCFTDRAQKKEWYARAEAHDSARACFTLAQLYYDDYEYENAAKYYSRCYNRYYYNTRHCAYMAGRSYLQTSQYSNALKWLKVGYDYSEWYYNYSYTWDKYYCAYYIGYLYKNGYGVWKDWDIAYDYYYEAYQNLPSNSSEYYFAKEFCTEDYYYYYYW